MRYYRSPQTLPGPAGASVLGQVCLRRGFKTKAAGTGLLCPTTGRGYLPLLVFCLSNVYVSNCTVSSVLYGAWVRVLSRQKVRAVEHVYFRCD